MLYFSNWNIGCKNCRKFGIRVYRVVIYTYIFVDSKANIWSLGDVYTTSKSKNVGNLWKRQRGIRRLPWYELLDTRTSKVATKSTHLQNLEHLNSYIRLETKKWYQKKLHSCGNDPTCRGTIHIWLYMDMCRIEFTLNLSIFHLRNHIAIITGCWPLVYTKKDWIYLITTSAETDIVRRKNS